MIKKTIITVLVIVAILGIAFAVYGNTKNTINTNNSTSSVKVNETVNNTTPSTFNNQTIINPTEARKIAKTFIEVSGATAGTPKLVNQDGNQVYIVPVINNGVAVGEIDIDAKTGKNLGGAGGAP